MPAVTTVLAWPLLLWAVQLGAATGAPQPWHCAPCPPERLALCPPLPASCSEPALPAGCGCCPTCALPLGAACGVATARCARGLHCRPLPGEPRPLHALTRGQGACQPQSDSAASSAEAPGAKGLGAPENMASEISEMTQEQLPGTSHPPALWEAVGNSGRELGAADARKGKEPCRRELHAVLDRLAQDQRRAAGGPYKFYLPNCNKDGLYHSKQCETSLDGEAGLCWCVDPWSGRKVPGSVEVRGDPGCQRRFH